MKTQASSGLGRGILPTNAPKSRFELHVYPDEVATNITQATTGVQDANSLIAQMSTASSDIAQDITNVDNVTSELRQGGELVQERALELAQLSEQLKMLVGQFKVR